MTRLRPLLAVLVCVGLLGGCDFAEKRKTADHIRRAPDLLAEVGTAKTTMTIGIEIASTSARASGLPPGGIPTLSLEGELDYANRRSSAVLAPPGMEPLPVQLVDGTDLYTLRQLPVPGAPRLSRPWRKIDLAGLYEDRERIARSAVGVNFVWQATVIDLVRGVLTGSVKRDGTEDIDGVPTTRYKVNVDLEKAFGDAPDELREAFEATRVVTGMKRLVHPGRVWLDDDGLPRRVEIRLKQERSRRDAIEVAITLDLRELGAPTTALDLPDGEDVASAKDLASFVGGDSPIYERAAAPAAATPTTTGATTETSAP